MHSHIRHIAVVILLASGGLAVAAELPSSQVRVMFTDRLGPLEIDKMALGQGGTSPEATWADRIAEIRALRPRVIRLFIQEYFDLLPERGRYHFETLDRNVDTILATGAKPLDVHLLQAPDAVSRDRPGHRGAAATMPRGSD